MADNIDIVIQDKVDNGIATKLDQIADSAINAESALTRLKASLALINSSPLTILQNAANSATNAINKNALANQRLTTEQERTAIAAAKAATAQQQTAVAAARLATEQQRTATATAQAAASQDRAALAALRLEEAQTRAASGAHRHGQSWLEMAKGMAAGMLIAHGIMLAVTGITGAINGGINAVDEYQQSVIQMSAILTSLAANQTDIAGTYKQAHSYAEGLNDTLQEVDAKTSLNLTNLQSITQEMAKQGVTLNTTNQSQVESFTRLANAVAVYSRNGKDERQVRQEVAALLKGEVKQGDELAKLLDRITGGHLKQMVVEWKRAGTTIDEIGKRLAGFGPAAEEINGTWSAATSSIQTSLSLISRAGFSGIVKDLVDYIQLGNAWLREHAQIIGSDIAVAWLSVKGIVGSIWDVLSMIYKGLDLIVTGSLNAMVMLLNRSQGHVVSMWEGFKEIMKGLGFTASVLLPTIIEKFVDVVKVASGLIIVAISFGDAMFEVIKSIGSGLLTVGLGFWKGITGDMEGAKAEFSKVMSGALMGGVEVAKERFRDMLKALKDDVKNLFSTSGLDSRLDKFFQASTVKGKNAGSPAPELSPPVAPVDKNAEKRETALAKINSELDKQINNMYLLKNAREVANKLDQIEINFAAKKWKLSEDEISQIRRKLQAIEDGKATQQAFDSIYEKSIGPLRDYNAAQKAGQKLLDMNAISQADYNRAMLLAKNTYEEAAKPMIAINRELDQQARLLGYVGQAQLVAQQMQQYENELRQKGFVLSAQERVALEYKVATLIHMKSVNSELNKIYDAGMGKQIQLRDELEAVEMAYRRGAMTNQAYKQSLIGIGLANDKLQLEMGTGKFINATRAGLGHLIDGYKNVLSSLSDSFGNFFTNIADGFANSIGRAVVYSKDLKEALVSVSQEALAGLISSLVKVGIQYAINAALGASFAAAATTASVAEAAAISSAWATPAALVSLATMGANAAPAATALTGTVALSQFMAIAGFESGGYTGDGGRRDIAGVVHGREFVVNADATSRNRELLESINRGEDVSKSSSKRSSGVNISIHNYGSSKQFEVQQLSETEIRIIAKDEAKRATYEHAPKAVAASIGDPNSIVSKSLGKNTKTERRR